MPVVILALGAASTVLWIATNAIRERLLVQDLARIRAVREVRLAIATSHLWLEEYLTGDRVDVAEIWSALDEAHDLAQAILRGGEVGPGPAILLQPLAAPALRLRAQRLGGWIDRLRDLARRRLEGYRAGDDTGIGSAVDADYDRLFHLASAESEALERQMEGVRERDEERAHRAFVALLLVWLLLVAVAAWGLWHRERRRRQAEAALKKSEEQLLQAQKLEAVGRLAGGLAHDINNYVTAITSHCELVKMQRPDARVSEKMDLVIATANRISLLVRRLLAFSKRQPVQPRVVILNEVVEGLETMIRGLLGEDLQLETYLSPGLWPVRVDPSQIEQTLVNLLVNAREASPRGGKVTVETANYRLGRDQVEAGLALPAGDSVMIAVSDTGEGIRPEVKDKIFDPFFTTKPDGNGLGLATVYGIVQQNGGRISVYSEPGHGTTFKVYLPRSVEPAAAAAVAPGSAGVARGEGETILLIEDNTELRQATQGILQALGYRVEAAAGGEEALALLDRRGAFDLVVSDVVMPGLSGKEVVERIRARHDGQRVLFISGYTDNVVLRHGILEGEFDFLEKPFSAERLAAKVREVLARPRPAPAGL